MMFALVILGPTASGKTSLAIALSKYLRCEIISLDSALVYKGMNIGSAKPTIEEMSLVRHHLIDICDPKDSYSAADFRTDCIAKVKEITQRGALPIICGGTMMYYKALVEGLSPLPPTDEKVRADVLTEALTIGWPKMHEKLKNIDPKSYSRLNPNDKQRISRALEVYYQTGRSMSSFFDEHPAEACPFDRFECILLPENDDRTYLRALIRERFMQMLDQGFVEEVKALKSRGDLNLNMPSMRCVGYRQIWEYLDGKYDFDTMKELAIHATSHLAKHQMTWLRGALANSSNNKLRLDIGDINNLKKVLVTIKPYIKEFII